MVTIEQARAVRDKIAPSLKNRNWFRGIGITKMNDDYAVKVNVHSHNFETQNISPLVDNVQVIVDVVGDIIPH